MLIEWFFHHKTANRPRVFGTADIDEYARVYRAPGAIRAMLGYYRAVHEDSEQNAQLGSRRLPMPVLAWGGKLGSAPGLHDALRPWVEARHGGVMADCGHYIPEEQPARLAASLLDFLAPDREALLRG